MHALLYVYEWTDGQVLSFVKKSGWNVKGAHVNPCQNAPGGAKTTCYHYSVTQGNQENLKRKQLKNIDFETIQQHFLRQFPNNIF